VNALRLPVKMLTLLGSGRAVAFSQSSYAQGKKQVP